MDRSNTESAVRRLATPRFGDVIAAALSARTISTWCVKSGRRLAEFDSEFDIGGTRLAVAGNVGICLVGSYRLGSIAAYSMSSGALLWHLGGVGRVQNISITGSEVAAYVCNADRQGVIVELCTGLIIDEFRGLSRVWQSMESKFRVEGGDGVVLVDQGGAKVLDIHDDYDAVMAVDFNDRHVAVSEVGGCLRVIEIASQQVVARCEPPPNQHFLRVCLSSDGATIRAIQWDFVAGGPKQLGGWKLDGEPVQSKTLIGLPVSMEFYDQGNRLVTTDGTMYDCVTGGVCGSLPFPREKALDGGSG